MEQEKVRVAGEIEVFMSVQAIRFYNLLAFRDSDWFEIRPVTYVYGRNSSGKSAIGRAFIILQNTLGLGIAGNVAIPKGIINFSKNFYWNSEVNDLTARIVFEFKCLPELGLVSKISEFSRFRDLNLEEENEYVVFQIAYQKATAINYRCNGKSRGERRPKKHKRRTD